MGSSVKHLDMRRQGPFYSQDTWETSSAEQRPFAVATDKPYVTSSVGKFEQHTFW